MPLLLLPLIIVVFLVAPETVTFNNSFKAYGMTSKLAQRDLYRSLRFPVHFNHKLHKSLDSGRSSLRPLPLYTTGPH